MARIELAHPPRNREELWWSVRVLFGVTIPRTRVCPDHCSPFDAFADAYFRTCTIGQGEPYPIGRVIWHASRGLAGKSKTLATLGLTLGYIDGAQITILGGSLAQSNNVHNYMTKGMESQNLPREMTLDITATRVTLTNASEMRPIPASQKTVRGPHPSALLMDEVDEMELAIYDAALGQPLPQKNNFDLEVPVLTVVSSTWQNPDGTLTEIFRRQEEQEPVNERGDPKTPIYRWCYLENHEQNNPVTVIDLSSGAVLGNMNFEQAKSLENTAVAKRPEGWLAEATIQQKKDDVSAEMFRIEYDLGEPSIGNRAIDTELLDLVFAGTQQPVWEKHAKDWDEYRFAEPEPAGEYVIGADWAQENDYTTVTVARVDTPKRQVVYAGRLHRTSWMRMIGIFNRELKAYDVQFNGAWHDRGGIGGVIKELVDPRAKALILSGKIRDKLLDEYVVAIERATWEYPKVLRKWYTEHKFCRTGDLYSSGEDYHLPDTFCAGALAEWGAKRAPARGKPIGIERDGTPGKMTRHFQHPSEEATHVEGPEPGQSGPRRRIELRV